VFPAVHIAAFAGGFVSRSKISSNCTVTFTSSEVQTAWPQEARGGSTNDLANDGSLSQWERSCCLIVKQGFWRIAQAMEDRGRDVSGRHHS